MRIITPVDGQKLTDIALHFVWEPDEKADDYRIEFSEDAAFGKPKIPHIILTESVVL